MKILQKKLFIITAIIVMINPLYAKVIHTKIQDELYIKTKHEHNHSCSAKEELTKKNIQRAARKRVWMLVQAKTISASWLEMPIVSTDKKQFQENVEWVVNYRDVNVKDENKQNIYIFVDFYGHVLGANYDGK